MLDGDTTYEVHFKPLDAPATSRTPRVVGVGVFDGDIRLGRPIDWNLRAASKLPGQRFIAYQSPRQFLFSIYERFDHPQEPWPDVLLRYERDLEAQGAQIVSARMPIATANAQGRGYFLKTKVPAKPDYVAYSHEYLVRTDARVLLVQVVHAESIEPIADEVAQVLASLTAY